MTDQPEDTASLVARLVREIDADRITSDEATALQTALFARMGRGASRMLAAAFAHHAGRTDIAAALLTRSPEPDDAPPTTVHVHAGGGEIDPAKLERALGQLRARNGRRV